jgi:hypothetical protein
MPIAVPEISHTLSLDEQSEGAVLHLALEDEMNVSLTEAF